MVRLKNRSAIRLPETKHLLQKYKLATH